MEIEINTNMKNLEKFCDRLQARIYEISYDILYETANQCKAGKDVIPQDSCSWNGLQYLELAKMWLKDYNLWITTIE